MSGEQNNSVGSQDLMGIQAKPYTPYASVSIRKISNGYIVSVNGVESCYYDIETMFVFIQNCLKK